MTIAEIKEEILHVIRESTETEVDINEQTHIIHEMNLSSIEVMMMISDLESRFGINIPTEKLRDVRTISDLCQLVIEALR